MDSFLETFRCCRGVCYCLIYFIKDMHMIQYQLIQSDLLVFQLKVTEPFEGPLNNPKQVTNNIRGMFEFEFVDCLSTKGSEGNCLGYLGI